MILSRSDLREKATAYGISDYMIGGIERYVFDGVKPGDFLYAVLCNDFFEAIWRADTNNLAAIADWARFLHDCLPRICWGSAEAVEEWMAARKQARAAEATA